MFFHFPKASIVIFLMAALVLLFLTLWGAAPEAMPLVLVSSVLFFAFAALCWRFPWARGVSIAIAFFWALNTIATVLCKIEYDGMPSSYMAESILATNREEASGMIFDHPEYIAFFFIFLGFLLYLVIKASRRFSRRALGRCSILLLVFSAVMLVVYGIRHRGDGVRMTLRTSAKTPFYHAASLLAVHLETRYERMETTNPADLPKVTARATDIEVHVLIIGESVRRKNMGIYGASRDTTPEENAEKSRMFLFTNAIAPAGGTIAAIPKTLCLVGADGTVLKDSEKNIIAVANRAGFKTSWLSNQEDYNPSYAAITRIMKQAGEVSWKHTTLDEDLLAKMEISLKKPGKKLIILHFRGSHEPHAKAFPESHRKFFGGDSREDNYDNSIFYTDSILGKIFRRLQNEKASVFYYSDHALVRKKKFWSWKYRHGGGVREAYEIPQWIWYSPRVESPARLGVMDLPYSTSENYHLLKDWLGVDVEGESAPSPLRPGWKPSEIFVDGKIPFASLPPE